jgi:O-antigen/teichoic acid export membrane protein
VAALDGGVAAMTTDAPVFEPEPEDGAVATASGRNRATKKGIRGSGILLLGRGISMGSNFLIQVLIVRHLSKSDYGAFAYALSLSVAFTTFIELGLDRSITRFLPIYDERGEPRKVVGTLLMQLATVLTLGLSLVLVVIGLRGWLTGRLIDDSQATTLLAILVLLAPVQALDNMCQNLFAVFARARAIFIRRHVLNPALRLGVVLLLLATGSGAAFLAAGYVLAGVVGLVIYGFLAVKVLRQSGLGPHLSPRAAEFPVREVLAFTFPLLASDLLFTVMNTSDAILLGSLDGTEAVASFRAIQPLAGANHLVFASFGVLFTPLIARLFARRDEHAIDHMYWSTAIWVTVLSFPIFVVTFALARPLTVTLLESRYASSATYLAMVSFGYFIDSVLGFNGLTLKALGKVRAVVVLNLAAGTLNVVLNILLIPRYGPLGAAIGTTVTLVVHNVLKQVALARTTNIRLLEWRAAKVYLLVAAATAAVWLLDMALGPPFLVALGIAGLASVLVLLGARHSLEAGETFPELARVPLIRRLVPTGERA